jgi:tripartite-type tricarboxylate transporter receptor subunit TctC
MFQMMKAVLRNAAVLAVAVGSVGLAGAGPAMAEWPERPVTIVVPYGPGAVNDLYARFIAQKLSEKFGSPFLVDNRPGGGNGSIGTIHVQRAEPDGYTFLEHQNIIAILGQGTDSLTFNAGTDLTGVALLAQSPEAILIPTSIGVDTPQELADYARNNPGQAFYGVGGLGSARHMLSAKIVSSIDAPMNPVPFTSGADTMTALATGRIIMQLSSPNTAQSMIDAGKVKVLAYLGENVSKDAPEAPTLATFGFDIEASAWWGIFAPNGTPPEIVEKMNAAINEITTSAEFVELSARAGGSVHPLTAAEFGDMVKAEVKLVNDLREETGIVTPAQ